MNNQDLVDAAIRGSGVGSQRELAKLMNLNNSSLSLLKNGKGELSDETYIKLAELAGLDPAEVIIEKHARKAGSESRKVWERLRHALAKSGSVLAICWLPQGMIANINTLGYQHAQNELPRIGIMRHTARQ
jgi:transcriptional regulator with XRE-family HTH domain